ncbi:MAG: N-6 DNA methylase, partial [Anaerolineae bacterium]|nr:N-6 DNA methylase [Anaerolineae bacterium]
SRFEHGRECWLEKWMRTAQNDGTRAYDQLRQGVQDAIERLGTGFYAQNRALLDTIGGKQFYHELLRLVYRMIFLIVAEDRDLLHLPDADPTARERYARYYSMRRLRDLAMKRRGTHHRDLYEMVKWLMNALRGDAHPSISQQLGLPILGSDLFDAQAIPNLNACTIRNDDFLAAIRHITYFIDKATNTYRLVDYRNMGSEELGSVYEALLEMNPQISDERRFVLTITSGNERKTTGSYYTPTALIEVLLKTSLDPILQRAKRGGENAILALKICDPACGSGHFLIAAAHRIGRVLAQIRTGDDEPTSQALNKAVRDVISHCIYGVDLNPMAVELCKVNLWLESLEAGKPLTFDHRVLVGNSLFGTTPALMQQGIPNEAFTMLTGDHKQMVNEYKGINRGELKARQSGQLSIFEKLPADYTYLTRAMNALEDIPQDNIAQIHEIERRYLALAQNPEYRKAKLLADAWCAAFVWEKNGFNHDLPMPITDRLYRQLEENPDNLSLVDSRYIPHIARLADEYHFFHWHIAFPDVFVVETSDNPHGWTGGFDCVLGNPPWERIKLQEKEWFAQRAPEIANAPNANARKQMIDHLRETENPLYLDFLADLRKAEGESHYARSSNRFPLCGRGDVNTYALFAETARQLLHPNGRAGIIVPSGIATDDTTKFFFQDVVDTQSLVAFYDFENRLGIFPAIDSRMKFALMSLSNGTSPQANFTFFALDVADLDDPNKQITLSPADIAIINPNTRTAPTFRTRRDADITKRVYERVPILIQEEPVINPWGISFMAMFHMSADSGLFRTADDLQAGGYRLDGNWFVKGDDVYLPLYEAKMMHQYTHRWATYVADGNTRDMELSELHRPNEYPLPRYWVHRHEVMKRTEKWDYRWLIASRDICRATDNRTGIISIFPISASSGVNIELMYNIHPHFMCCFVSNFTSYAFDYIIRQKIGSTHLSQNYLKQLPTLPPQVYTPDLLAFIVPRVAELTYTAWDMQAFARDIGYDGAPFMWDEYRRFVMRCELDALYFHLYGLSREDVDYILDTFPIVKRKDEAQHGEYLTKRAILTLYDELAGLPQVQIPAPKGEGTVLVPDVRGFVSELNPPPADDAVRHEA